MNNNNIFNGNSLKLRDFCPEDQVEILTTLLDATDSVASGNNVSVAIRATEVDNKIELSDIWVSRYPDINYYVTPKELLKKYMVEMGRWKK